MAAADVAAISSGTAADELMERAGRAVARTALQMAGGRYGKRVVIVCGKGNNGGDGFVAARILKGQGVGVTVFLVDGAPRSGPAAHHLRLMEGSGVAVNDFDPTALNDADAVVDAIFGTGFSGAPEGAIARVIEAVNRCGA
ncbi:MAG: NAD(P)H-hydrate epimerase, partial [Actinobacteria bacterium]|nr:NAD(P)H-hydrate epimerase [Actinomycetota bacterium]